MCYGCYEEYGKPEELTERTLPVIRLIEEVYANSAVGGNCHVVLDDWNLEDDYLYNIMNQEIEPLERQCMEAMIAMSMDERATALAIHDRMLDLDKLIERMEG